MKGNKNNKSTDNGFFSNDEIIAFFDYHLSTFRKQLKTAKTKEELDMIFRFCDATSYLKIMWMAEKNNHI